MGLGDGVVEGPLAAHVSGFGEHLRRLGYKEFQIGHHLCLVSDLSAWMSRKRIGPGELTADCLAGFFAERRNTGHRWLITSRAAGPLLEHLRGVGVVPDASRFETSFAVNEVLRRYRAFLVDQRGLAPGTVAGYMRAAELFCSVVGADAEALGSLTAAQVSSFVIEACARPVKVSPRELVSELRSFLRFLFVAGVLMVPLAQAVPSYASWRASGLPKFLTPGQTARLLASCDRRRAIGRRDYAVLVVLARLGLRSGEVAALRLDDIDWRAGELVVRGKPRREERIPLPADVGEALAAYLRRGRPRVESRAVFVRAIAPLVGLSPTGVTWVVYHACDQAGSPRVGAHRLRHTAATAVLREGGSLVEVGQLLGHRRVGTTAIYAKVDQAALARLARRWPGSAA